MPDLSPAPCLRQCRILHLGLYGTPVLYDEYDQDLETYNKE